MVLFFAPLTWTQAQLAAASTTECGGSRHRPRERNLRRSHPERVPERQEPHDGVPGEVDGVELDVRQVVQHVRV